VVLDGKDNRISAVKTLLAETGQMKPESWLPVCMFMKGSGGAPFFRVASSLDSMVLGEPQILGQVKDAYGQAVGCKGRG